MQFILWDNAKIKMKNSWWREAWFSKAHLPPPFMVPKVQLNWHVAVPLQLNMDTFWNYCNLRSGLWIMITFVTIPGDTSKQMKSHVNLNSNFSRTGCFKWGRIFVCLKYVLCSPLSLYSTHEVSLFLTTVHEYSKDRDAKFLKTNLKQTSDHQLFSLFC